MAKAKFWKTGLCHLRLRLTFTEGERHVDIMPLTLSIPFDDNLILVFNLKVDLNPSTSEVDPSGLECADVTLSRDVLFKDSRWSGGGVNNTSSSSELSRLGKGECRR